MLMWRQAADVTGWNEDMSFVTEDVREAVREDGLYRVLSHSFRKKYN